MQKATSKYIPISIITALRPCLFAPYSSFQPPQVAERLLDTLLWADYRCDIDEYYLFTTAARVHGHTKI